MNTLAGVARSSRVMLLHPLRAGRALAGRDHLRQAAWLVTGFGIFYGLAFFISHLARDYPPAPEVLRVWMDAWGAFAMLPFIKIPAEEYRLFLAVIALPLALAAWILMGGSARLLAILLGGQVDFEGYLCLTAFGFFPIWLLASLLDMLYNRILGPYIIPGLTGQYGRFWQAFFQNFPPLEYTLLFSLAGVLIALSVWSAERAAQPSFAAWKAALIGWAAFAWPTLLIAFLVR